MDQTKKVGGVGGAVALVGQAGGEGGRHGRVHEPRKKESTTAGVGLLGVQNLWNGHLHTILTVGLGLIVPASIIVKYA